MVGLSILGWTLFSSPYGTLISAQVKNFTGNAFFRVSIYMYTTLLTEEVIFFFSVSNIHLLYFFHLPKVPWNLKKKDFFFFFETCHIKRIKKKKEEKVVKGKGLSQDKISTYYGSPLTNGYLIFLSFVCLFVCI